MNWNAGPKSVRFSRTRGQPPIPRPRGRLPFSATRAFPTPRFAGNAGRIHRKRRPDRDADPGARAPLAILPPLPRPPTAYSRSRTGRPHRREDVANRKRAFPSRIAARPPLPPRPDRNRHFGKSTRSAAACDAPFQKKQHGESVRPPPSRPDRTNAIPIVAAAPRPTRKAFSGGGPGVRPRNTVAKPNMIRPGNPGTRDRRRPLCGRKPRPPARNTGQNPGGISLASSLLTQQAAGPRHAKARTGRCRHRIA